MQLVGARDSFIHRPFLLEGGITGSTRGRSCRPAHVHRVLVRISLTSSPFRGFVGMGRHRCLVRNRVRSPRQRICGPQAPPRGVACGASTARSGSQWPSRSRRRPLAGQVVEIRREFIDSQRRLEEVREERSCLQRELTNFDGRCEMWRANSRMSNGRSVRLGLQWQRVDFQVDAVGSQIEGTSRNLLHTRERFQTSKAILHRRIRDIYKRGALHSVRVMLGAGSFPDLMTRYGTCASSLRTIARWYGAWESSKRIWDNRTTIFQISMISLGRLRQSRTQRSGPLYALWKIRIGGRSMAITPREEMAANRMGELDRDETRISALLTDLEARRVEIERAAARRGAPSTLLTADVGTMDWPVDGELIYRFGREERPNGTILRWNGIGIAAPTGTPIQAVEAGNGSSGRSLRRLRSDGGAEPRRRFLYTVPLPRRDRR